MTAWNTGTAVSNGASDVASYTVTVPAGVLGGDFVLVPVSGWDPPSGVETMQASSTGTALTQIGTQQHVVFNSHDFFGGLFYFIAAGTTGAASSDVGKVITASFVSGDHAAWALGIGAWTGASTSTPIDVSGMASNSGNGSTLTCPSETTGVAGDWCIQVVCAALGGSAWTGGTGFTEREGLSDTFSGAAVLIYDSNSSVGPAGTSMPGATFANAGNNSWWTGWTIGLAPAPTGSPVSGFHLLLASFP